MRISANGKKTSLTEEFKQLGLIPSTDGSTSELSEDVDGVEEGTSGHNIPEEPVDKKEYERWKKEYKKNAKKEDKKDADYAEDEELENEEFDEYDNEEEAVESEEFDGEQFDEDEDYEYEEDYIEVSEEEVAAAEEVVEAFNSLSEDERGDLDKEDLQTYIAAKNFLEGISLHTTLASGQKVRASGDEKKRRIKMRRAGSLVARKSHTAAANRKRKISMRRSKSTGPLQMIRKGKKVSKSRGKRRTENERKRLAASDMSSDLKSIVQELKQLSDNLGQRLGENDFDHVDEISNKIISGFENVCDLAFELACRVDEDLSKTEWKDNDKRLKAGKFFECIAKDASAILQAIEEGDVEISDAIEDLTSISNDLYRGIEKTADIN